MTEMFDLFRMFFFQSFSVEVALEGKIRFLRMVFFVGKNFEGSYFCEVFR